MTSALPAAYGVRVAGLPASEWLALTDAEDWPELRLERGTASRPQASADGGYHAGVAADLGLAEIVHPTLSGLALTIAVLRGDEALHAGALVGAAGVYAIVGVKEAGKSTLLAACAARGAQVVADDALIVSGRRCLSGPRAIDLRPEAPDGLGPTVAVRPTTPRLRLTLPPIAAEHDLAGVVYLAWGERAELRPLPPGASATRLLEMREAVGFPRDPVRLLDLAGVPAFELSRPRGPGELEAAVELLARELGMALSPRRAARAPSS